MTNSIETFTHTFALPPCPDHLGSRHHTQGRSRWYEHHTQQLHRRLSKLPLPIYRSIECVGCYTSVHSARSRQQCSVTSSYTVHNTYILFVHVFVGVSRGPDHTVGVQSSMKRVVDHTPTAYTRWQEHIISLPSSICGLGGGDKKRGAPRTSITESDTEIKRETCIRERSK